MTSTDLRVVVTTIQPPTPAVEALAGRASGQAASILVIGDRKGPSDYPLAGTEFISLAQQQRLDFDLADELPENHYARKNLGYLLALQHGAECIYETDDDNAPLPRWTLRRQKLNAVAAEPRQWVNAYQHFSSANIWPRGFPLDEIAAAGPAEVRAADPREVVAPIQQGLANGSPDVDAVWRLILDQPVEFDNAPSVWLPPGSWCPFNSQSTWWWRQAYPLMYLPSHCSFRMTDIWRSFIAQRCLWELGYGVVFHAPEVLQERNEHDLMRDFSHEISGYLRNKEMVGILQTLNLEAGEGAQGRNLLACYRALSAAGFFPEQEMQLVAAWLDDLAALGMDNAARR